jgi:hypothetical protein
MAVSSSIGCVAVDRGQAARAATCDDARLALSTRFADNTAGRD